MFLYIGIIATIAPVLTYLFAHENEVTWLKFTSVVLIVAAAVLSVIHFTTAEGQRMIKSISSNTSGGLERTVQVFDQSGNMIREYSGKIDIQDTEYGNKVLFDLDGKRTVIYNATVIVQED